MNKERINEGLYSSASDEWSTPQAVIDALSEEFEFVLDVCATDENAKADTCYTRDDDGLEQNWQDDVEALAYDVRPREAADRFAIWMNPPYGTAIGKWVKKAADEAEAGSYPVVCLLPARTDTAWFHKYVMQAAEIRFIKGRLRFGGSTNSAPFPSMVVVFQPSVSFKPQDVPVISILEVKGR
jgi:phage N-6-adenine-methyltransferase